MEVDGNHMTGKILSLTLKIIYLLTGEDYVPIKRSDDNITAPLPPSHEGKNEEKILELTNKIIELLTGEGPCSGSIGHYANASDNLDEDENAKDKPMTGTEEDNIHVWATLKCKEEEIPMAICADQSNQTDSRGYQNISQGDEAQCKEEEIPTDISSGKLNFRHMHQSSQRPVNVTQHMADLLVGRREDSLETKNAHLNIVVIDSGEGKLRFKEEEEEIPIGPRSDFSKNKFQKAPRPLNSKECIETEDEESDDTEEDEGDSVGGLKIIVKSEQVATHVRIKEEVASVIISDGTKARSEHEIREQDTAVSTADKKIFPFNRKLMTAEKPFFCADCGGFFKHKSSLVLHRRIHSGEKPFTCSHCGKEFIQKANYIRHQRLHTGEKPYKCTECGKLYAQKQSLLLHQKFHAENEPFSCPECGENFIRQSHLVNHRKTHKGLKRYLCPDCGDFFMLRSSLVIHQRVHSAEKPLTSSID